MNDEKYERLEAKINRTTSSLVTLFLLLFDYYVSARIIHSSLFAYDRSVFDVIKTQTHTHINNIDEENGYCVMMVLADSKNVIKIFFSSAFSSSSHSIILLFFVAVVFTKISRKQKKKEERKE
jgi:hypothetical protein